MIIVDLYLISTVLSGITTMAFSTSLKRNLEDEGYQFTKEENTFKKKFSRFKSALIECIIPGYNALNALGTLAMWDMRIEYSREQFVEEGKVLSLEDKMAEKRRLEQEELEEDNDYYFIPRILLHKQTTAADRVARLLEERENLLNLYAEPTSGDYIQEQSNELAKRR